MVCAIVLLTPAAVTHTIKILLPLAVCAACSIANTNFAFFLSSRHVAEQWTLIDWEMFRAIPGYELLALAWEKPRCVNWLFSVRDGNGLFSVFQGLFWVCVY